jgi:hypothetical protein
MGANLDDTQHLLPSGYGVVVDSEVYPKSNVMSGVGPDALTVENEKGGRQSLKKWRFDLIDCPAIFLLGRVLDAGAKKYDVDNWRKIEVESHINSVIMHAYAYLSGDRSDDHLGHMFCRAMFAVGIALSEGYDARQADER